MAPPPKERLRALTDEEQATLTRLSRAGSERADRVRRATALLAVGRGASFAQAARGAGFRSGTTVGDLVGRFNRGGLVALSIAAGRGPKATYDPAARAQIVAAAQRPPDRRDDGTATWSLATLQRTLRREALPGVGATTVAGCCARRAARTSRRAPGARPGRPSASARTAWCGWSTR